MLNRGLGFLSFVAFLILTTGIAWSQGIPLATDTLRIVNVTAAAGDTGIRIPIALHNTLAVGGYGVRFTFNSNVLIPRLSGNAIVTENTSRTDTLPFFVYGGSVPSQGVVTFSEAVDVQQRPCSTCAVFHIAVGSGPVVLLVFDVAPTAAAGTYNLVFQDDPISPASFNRYSDTTGFQLYAPVLANGVLTITGGVTPGNDPPNIASVPNQSVTEGETLTFNVTATDPEGDNVTLQAVSLLPANSSFPTVVGDSTVTGTFTFTPNLSQGPDLITVTFRATDDSGEFTQRSVQIEVIDRPQDILVVDSTAGGIPGKTEVLVPIILNNIQPVFGVQFDLQYNDSLITIDSFLIDTSRFSGFDIYSNLGDSAGFVTVVAFSLGGDSVPVGNGPIMYAAVTIDSLAQPDTTFLRPSNGRESISKNPNDPSNPLTALGGGFIIDAFGNINLQDQVDVMDAVIMVNYLLYGIPLSPRQLDVADVNRDSSIDVGDLVGIINIILGRPINAPTFYVSGLAEVTLGHDDFQPGNIEDIQLEANFEIPVAGVEVVLDYNPSQIRFVGLKTTGRSASMTLQYRDDISGRLKFIMYYSGKNAIDIGTGSILTLRAAVSPNLSADEKVYLKISKLVLADTGAVVIPTGGGPIVPTDFKLEQNFPNPFNAQTTIRYEVPFNQGNGEVRTVLKVYNILGQKVKTLVDEPRQPGRYQITWDGKNDSGSRVSSGMYFYRLKVGSHSESKKMTLLK